MSARNNFGSIFFTVGAVLTVLKAIGMPLLASAPWWLVTLPMWIGVAAGLLLWACIAVGYVLIYFLFKILFDQRGT